MHALARSMYVSMYGPCWSTWSWPLATGCLNFHHVLDCDPVVCFGLVRGWSLTNLVLSSADVCRHTFATLSRSRPCSVQTHRTMRFNANSTTVITLQKALLICASVLSNLDLQNLLLADTSPWLPKSTRLRLQHYTPLPKICASQSTQCPIQSNVFHATLMSASISAVL